MLSHLRNYVSAGLISGLVGLFSFPLLTRNLSVAEYGIVGLITSSMALMVALGKLGVQHAVIRFFAQVENNNIDYSMDQLNSTVCVVFFLFASVTTSIWVAGGVYLLPAFMQFEDLSALFVVASVAVFIRLLGSSAMNLLRAQQRSGDVAVAGSISRCLHLIFVILLLSFSILSPWTIIVCLSIAELAAVSYAFYCYSPYFRFSPNNVSGALAKALLFYGLPLMILESLELVLRLSDRYMIESMIGPSALGQYSASYNFSGYIDMIIIVAMVQALKPAYMQMWESEGRAKTQAFLSKVFRIFLTAGIPFITIFAITAPHLLSFLAGEKYAPGTVIIPYLALSYLLQGSMHIMTAGLYIFKDTKVLVIWSSIATVLNLALNLMFIPKFGITGAAVVTLLSFGIFTAGVSTFAFRYVGFSFELRTPLLIALASAFVFALLNPMDFGPDTVDFFVKGFVGTTILMLVMWFIEEEVRTWMAAMFSRFFRKEAKS